MFQKKNHRVVNDDVTGPAKENQAIEVAPRVVIVVAEIVVSVIVANVIVASVTVANVSVVSGIEVENAKEAVTEGIVEKTLEEAAGEVVAGAKIAKAEEVEAGSDIIQAVTREITGIAGIEIHQRIATESQYQQI